MKDIENDETPASPPPGVSGSRSTKRSRRSKTDIKAIKDALYDFVESERPVTVRQSFYNLEMRGFVKKTEGEYKRTIVRLLGVMRKDGVIPYEWIADATRWTRRPRTHSGLEQALEETRQAYRRRVWDDQNAYVEVWLEKEALAGVVVEVTGQWDVPLMVTRGYPSLSYLHSCGMMLRSIKKPAFIYYFGDHDPSGVDIPRKVEAGIREFAPDVEVHFEVVGVTPAQIVEMKLPTRPTKDTDTRKSSFKGRSTELDAIPPKILRELVDGCITRHLDADVYDMTLQIEAEERRSLERMTSLWDRLRRNGAEP